MVEIKRKKFLAYKCKTCNRCVIECAVRHSTSKELFNAINETPPPMARLLISIKNGAPYMSVCQDCRKPQCISACESHAISKDNNGKVVIDQSKCTGCWSCFQACSFSAIFRDEARKVAVNCDNCIGYNDFGCVEACPAKAIVCDE